MLFTSSNEAYAGLEAMSPVGSEIDSLLPIPTPEHVPLVVNDPYNPRWSYGGSKLAGELLMIATAKQYDVPAVIVRPHNFYGPRAGHGHVIPQMIDRIAKREEPFRIWGADQTRSFCYIDDAVDAMIRTMALASVACPTFHIGSPVEIRMAEIAHLLFDIAKWTPANVERLPAPAGSVARRCPDTRKIRASTGWEATTPLAVGLRRTVEWYLNAGAA